MDASGFSTTTQITDRRIAEMEARGERARRECRSRIPAAMTFSAVETKAFQLGWDREEAKIAPWFNSRA